MTDNEYRKAEGLSSSDIKMLLRNPMKMRHRQMYPFPATDAQRFGTLYHLMVLEPEKFKEEYIVMPPEIRQRRGKAWEAFSTEYAHKTIITQKEHHAASLMLQAFQKPYYTTAAELLAAEGEMEKPIFWTDPEYGFRCKIRPDKIIESIFGNRIIDLKTTTDASAEHFPYSIRTYGYDISAAWYLEGMRQETGEAWDNFFWIAQEKSSPFAISVFRCSQERLDAAWVRIREAKRIYAESLERGIWESYPDYAVDV